MAPKDESWWKTLFPPADWLPEYQRPWLRSDIVAGITLAAYAIPVSLAYAGLAGLPPEVEIYGYLLGGLGYVVLGSSPQLAVGPTSAISLIVGGIIAQMAGDDAVRYGHIAILAGLTVALLWFLVVIYICLVFRFSQRFVQIAECLIRAN
jgi:sulfate permease, SulP family